MIKNKSYAGITFKLYLFFSIVLLVGVLTGALIARMLPYEQCTKLALPMKNTFSKQGEMVYLTSFVRGMKPALFMWISGFFAVSVYCNMIAVLYKGTVLGLSIGVLLKVYGTGRGIGLSLAGILPQYFVLVPVLMYLCIATFEFSKSRQKPKRKIINYVVHLAIALTGCLLTALADTYVTSFLLQLCTIGE